MANVKSSDFISFQYKFTNFCSLLSLYKSHKIQIDTA